MEWRLKEGDYVPNEQGGLEQLEGIQALRQRVLFRLQARRGAFPFLPELGSQLYRLLREKRTEREALALRYVTQALEEERDVKVNRVELEMEGENRVRLKTYLDWQGTPLRIETELRE